MSGSTARIIFALAFFGGFIPGSVPAADDARQAPDPLRLMAVTIDRHIVGPGEDPSFLRALSDIGEVIIIDRNAGEVPWLASAGMLMDAPVEKAYESVTDFMSYPEFMPQTEGARVEEVAPGLYDVEFDIVVRIVYIPVKVVSAIYHYNQPPFRTDWAAKNPEFNLNYGFWELIPVDEGKRTIAFYTLYSKINQGMAKRILETEPNLEMMASMSTSTLVVRAMKDRAELLHRRSGGQPPPERPAQDRGVLDILRENPGSLKSLGSGGRLLVIEESDPVMANVAVVFEHPPEKVWGWLIDVEGQTGNDPHLKVDLIERSESGIKARFEWEVNLVLTFTGDYILHYELEKPRRITWRSVPGSGSIEGMHGSWDLLPLEGGKKTLALFRNTFDLESLGLLMKALLRIEPTFELAIQASQNLAVVENIEQCLNLTEEERREMVEQRTKALQDFRKTPVMDAIDLTPAPDSAEDKTEQEKQ